MPVDSLKITRNFRGGLLRAVRLIAGIALLYFGSDLLGSQVLSRHTGFDPSLSPAKSALTGSIAGLMIVVAVYWLSGTLIRAAGVVLTLTMVPFVVIGYLLTRIGAPEPFRRLPMAYLLVGCTLIYTGKGEWTLVPFAMHGNRETLPVA